MKETYLYIIIKKYFYFLAYVSFRVCSSKVEQHAAGQRFLFYSQNAVIMMERLRVNLFWGKQCSHFSEGISSV